MKTNRLRALTASTGLALALSFAASGSSFADDKLQVVSTFSVLGDMVSRVGGDQINLTTLVGAGGDAHVFQPTPADAAALSQADVLFINGLEFEGWLERLVEASGFDGVSSTATAGLVPLAFGEEGHDEHDDHEGHDDHKAHDDQDDHAGHDHGVYDPHAWQSLEAAQLYVANIAATLSAADPANAQSYSDAAAAYVEEMAALHVEIIAMVDALPMDQRTVVTSHDAFGYFEETYGLHFLAPQGLSTESEASAGDLAALINQIREENIRAIFVESISDERLIETVAAETKANVGGTLYSDSLSAADGPAATYLDMMRYNAATLVEALR